MWRASLDVYRVFRDADVVPIEGVLRVEARRPSGHLAHLADRLPNDGLVELALAERLLRQEGGLVGSRAVMSRKDAIAMASRDLGAEPSATALRRMTEAQALVRLAAAEPLLASAESDRLIAGRVLLHQGAIAMAFGESDRARELLQRAYGASDALPIRYLACFLTGWLEDGKERTQSAASAYERALAVIPSAQSAVTALAQMWWVHGQVADAQRLVNGAVRGQAEQVGDPWPAYRTAGYLNEWLSMRNQMRAALQ